MSETWNSPEERRRFVANVDNEVARIRERRERDARDWERRRDEHFEKAASDKRLTDRDAGPPEDGWLWETAVRRPPLPVGTKSIVSAWTPPDLLWNRCPVKDFDFGAPPYEDEAQAVASQIPQGIANLAGAQI